uniref:Solute carrier family 45 member 4 n=1 Tax=Eptatretus burgeri TaxID=7764 RepID=A0A8C4QXV2_EPTBU
MTDVPERRRNGLFWKNIPSALSSQRPCVAEIKHVEGLLLDSQLGDNERHCKQGLSDSSADYQPFVRRGCQRPERKEFDLLEEHQINEDDDDDDDDDDEEKKVPTKRWIMHSAVMFGREFCYAIETALVAPTLLQIGLPEQYYSLTWFLSPVLALLFSPLIGSASDHCTSPWGRRRPFILFLCCGVLLGVTLFLNGASLGRLMRSDTTSWWCGLVFTVFGVVLMDFCADSTESPIRAYLLDIAQSEDQEMALNIHAGAAGLGGAIGYMIGGIKWTSTFLGEIFSSQQQIIFLFTIIIFTTSVALHLFSIPEKPLVTTRRMQSHRQPHCPGIVTVSQTKETARDIIDMASGEPLGKQREPEASSLDASVTRCRSEPILNFSPQPLTWPHCFDYCDTGDRKTIAGIGKLFSHCSNDGTLCSTIPFPVPPESARNCWIQEKKTASTVVIGESLIVCPQQPGSGDSVSLEEGCNTTGLHQQQEDGNDVRVLCKTMQHLPRELWRLCICNFVTWFTLLTFSLGYTDFMGQTVYGGNPTAPDNSTEINLYNSGVQMGCWGLVLYSFTTSVLSALFQKFGQGLSIKTIYCISTSSFFIGSSIMAMFPNVYISIVMMSTMGLFYMGMLYCPYALLGLYHEDEAFVKNSLVRTNRGYGIDCAILVSQVYISQILVATSLSFMVDMYGSVLILPIASAFFSFCSLVIAAFLVVYPERSAVLPGEHPLTVGDVYDSCDQLQSCTISQAHHEWRETSL